MNVFKCDGNNRFKDSYLKFRMMHHKVFIDGRKTGPNVPQARWAGRHLSTREKKGVVPSNRNKLGNGKVNVYCMQNSLLTSK